ncbi:glycosyltransferase [Lactiplantibacillus pentosus]|uniref:glycosyltransferase n=1 Tax=Lactiplantibacillus pentosus TaxID=1589 RepID=UPI001330A1B6|nr:glycosyltransferase [Lactiplantibacillus pentosus]MBQ0838069.1 glycosyltransferase [Lactiplantibacillus pentosus]MBU7465865.1 glycosyltransferase [Lactiplantibacillus pentosus]MBU7491711.1 glycosyltransferase [Lactiplantibacillus pentosus]MBU7527463.1 glycosyltransferase [Lactiplantibacillus pentosus]MDT6965514.1 glycosyltransferase [Lactiplantibacillus pentosus]
MTSKKKITIVTGPMAGHGGEESVITNFINHFADTYDFELYVSQMLGDSVWLKRLDERTQITIGTAGAGRITKASKLLRYMWRCDADAVIVFTPRLLFLTNLARKLYFRHFKLISWVQFSINDYFSTRDRGYLALADEHLAISGGIRQQLMDIGINQSRIHLIYNPIPKSNKTILPENQVTNFIYVARIQFKQQKNMQALFDACVQLKGDWTLHIYGTDSTDNQDEYRQCVAYIKRLKIEANIVWHGWIADVWSKIQHADALVLTSTSEGFGMVLAEGISRGIPAISFDCPVGPADIINKDNGILINNGDVTQFATAMQKFVDRKVYFSATHMKKSITNLYEDVYYPRTAELLDKLL